jgi:hypothetical protein
MASYVVASNIGDGRTAEAASKVLVASSDPATQAEQKSLTQV